MTSARVEASSLIPDLTHQTIDDGRLKFMQRLGAGGYGVVYRAIDTTSPCTSSNPEPKEYAVKVVQKAKPNTRSWRYQRREISAHNTLKDHPHILTLHQVIEDDSYIYHVLEYCPGGDLFSAVLERGMLMGNDELVKKVFVQILDAVHFCHENGIYHRDLKLENIMCMNDEATEVVVGDFGICTDATTSNSFGCGSKCYLSPECIGKDFNYKRYSPKTGDVWSLGILLVSMLVGCIPWKYASTDDQWFLNFMAHEEYLFRTLPISRKANTLLRRILTFDPKIRISIPELREEILRMDTFFVDPDEFDCASRWAQIMGGAYSQRSSSSAQSTDIGPLRDDNDSVNQLEVVVIKDSNNVFRIVDSFGTAASAFVNQRREDSDSDDSDDESVGPITPETHAQDPATLGDVPELKLVEGEDLEDPISLVPLVSKKNQRQLFVEPVLRPVQIAS